MSEVKADNFVTVVAVGTAGEQEPNNENINFDSNSPGYVTVLTIGDTENNNKVLKDVTEEVIVYRLPGERLGFGLKFEGGTKASEFVKRLFIQSCAADSPASRVKSSWGKLTEGDEVLEIDSIPVNTMTRIDCVRCLKDSNVAIKLLVRHIYENRNAKNKTDEEPPSVISAEEKRTIPPPPPVPPRKIPRKMLKNIPKPTDDNNQENPPPRQPDTTPPTLNSRTKKLQSPRGSFKSYYSPDVARTDRRFSDGSLGPPDAEVYVDLFLQESTQSLSESDDTGSTISTVIDRFGSFPTTTTSSFSGSLPSTPSVQKKLDISNMAIFDYEDKAAAKPLATNREENNNIITDDGSPLSFQDAPLSYGNENTKVLMPDDVDGQKEEPVVPEEPKTPVKKPPVPPRSKDTVLTSTATDNKKSENLPRLVDFVPKSSNGIKESAESNSAEIMRLFLENERYKSNYPEYDISENDKIDNYNNGIDLYSSKWSLSSQLATIGEVEEEGGSDISLNRPSLNSTPVVIVENADSNESGKQGLAHGTLSNKESNGSMETLPSDSRQPPDGHEFPDSIEDNVEPAKQNYCKDVEEEPPFNYKVQPSAMEEFPKISNLILTQTVSASNRDLRPLNRYDSTEDLGSSEVIPEPTLLHTRSQSLIDMSALSKQKNAKWNQLIEQRRKGLSKLKGLVIPESSEIDSLSLADPVVNIPEIKSHTATFIPVPKVDSSCNSVVPQTNNTSDALKSPIVVPPWSSSAPTNLPKYSPAFKRKSLQVYPVHNIKNENHDFITNPEFPKYCDKSSQRVNKVCDDDLNPPKSLESISSPTRSDCSFEYVSANAKKYAKETTETLQKTACKLEDESDNDSAVSSSQSSYNSRFSPPPSPTRSCDDDHRNPHRLLKPSSVEAINRKNILASAKCRSGKDINIGSPVIKRKTEEVKTVEDDTIVPKISAKEERVPVDEVKSEIKVWEKSPPITPPTSPPVSPEEVKPVSVEISKPKVPAPAANKTVNTEKESPPPQKPPVPTLVTLRPTVSTNRRNEDAKQNKPSPNRDLYGSSSILNRKSQPINVKALKASFENFGSAPPPMPQKVPSYKTQISATPRSSVKTSIAKAESEIAIASAAVVTKKSERLSDTKPKQVVPRTSLVEARKAVTPTSPEVKEIAKILRRNSNTVSLKLDAVGASLGITLAGGVDEDKEVTIHRIRYGSIAYHDGRLKKGDKIISVNGHPTEGLKHSEAAELLKEPVLDFTFNIDESFESVPSTNSNLSSRRSSSISTLSDIRASVELPEKTPNHVVTFIKDGAGLGFAIEGGKDSPMGDVPLLIKKIFTGGAADKNGELKVGDEVVMVNEIKFTNLTRIEAWNLMKKIPDGKVNIHIYR